MKFNWKKWTWLCCFAFFFATVCAGDWPGWLGTGSSGIYAGTGELNARPQRLQLPGKLWESEAGFGGTRGETQDSRRAARESDWDRPHHAGEGSPIIAGGKVFFAHYRPSGDVYDKFTAHRHLGMTQEELRAQRGSWEDGYILKHERWLAGATEVMTAVDLKTGKTLWETELADNGLNFNIGNKGGFGVTAAYHDGRVFTLGTNGFLYGVDAETGRVLWENDIGERTQMQQYYRKMSQSGATLAPRFRSSFLTAVVATDGVVLVSDEIFHRADMGMGTDFHYDRENGLMAFDARTGRRLWHQPETSRFSPPLVWKHGGRSHALAIGRRGAFLFDLHTGRELWHEPSVRHHPRNQNFAAAVSEDYLVVFDTETQYPVAHRITPEGLERLWRVDASGYGNFLIHGELGYMIDQGGRLLALEMETGRLLAETDYPVSRGNGGNPFLLAYKDWILVPQVGRNSQAIRFYQRNPAHLNLPPTRLETGFSRGYEISVLPALGERVLVLRNDFRLQAFQLP